MKCHVLIVAAGRGTRARGRPGDLPKQYRRIGDRAVIAHTIARFLKHPHITGVTAVIHYDDRAQLADATAEFAGRFAVVTGGKTRQVSVRNGLLSLAGDPPDIVLIHDGVRPFVSDALIDRTIAALDQHEAVLAATPVTDTLKSTAVDGRIEATVPRERLWAAQTPQGFRFPMIFSAHNAAAADGRDDFTDDAAVAEWFGTPVYVVEGDRGNVKLTTLEDIEMADRRLQSAERRLETRVGSGFDVHAFAAGDHVMLGGVRIDHSQALAGHSDADVALHAATDAVLGAIGAGDIGGHFPPSDPQWKGAASDRFLDHACALLRRAGGRLIHLDLTIICETPKVGPHREAIRRMIAAICHVEPGRISVKATTTERLGFTGRKEGIAAMATATVKFPQLVEDPT
ncbi:MAG: bifunctional 2-C-methyl-D-erythritol 4-phosphate cytidylyltransferase/2-C-methyl-D-erythritol 2,4-cyclodiphosphate synthase [Hyphomicrobiales bacterium]|nr:bifunctional 2-C-methyl-D-erythritol 4-phosphate cytidylyltransferase/2-C-methyl-D-erythritol 2,4-cyclodiphosphate synthase [Hyphomicrobiales bacterium]